MIYDEKIKQQTMELFKLRFAHNIDKEGNLYPHAENYFDEWYNRILNKTAYDAADYSTKQVLKYIGVEEWLLIIKSY